MRSSVRLAPAVLATVLFTVTVSAAVVVQEESGPDLTVFVGTYEVDVPDFGMIVIDVTHDEEAGHLEIAAMDQPALTLVHVEDERFELDHPEFGVILVEFLYDEGGEVESMALDSYEFSLVATKKKKSS